MVQNGLSKLCRRYVFCDRQSGVLPGLGGRGRYLYRSAFDFTG